MVYQLQTESEFLKKLVVDAYNRKYGKKIDPEQCSIRSITPSYAKKYGYLITTTRTDDALRLKFFFDFGTSDQVANFRLETDGVIRPASLADEVFVATGTVNDWYLSSGTYRFRWIGPKPEDVTRVFDVSGAPMVWMDGSPMNFVFME